MDRRIRILILVLLVFGLLKFNLITSAEENFTGNFNLVFGAKRLDQDDWEPVEDQADFGLEFNCKHPSWPISIAWEYIVSYDKHEEQFSGLNTKIEGATIELNVGILKIWDKTPHVRPYIGGGLCFMDAAVSGTLVLSPGLELSISDDGYGTGFWFAGGVYWTVWKHLNIGFGLKLTSVKVKMVIEEDGVLQEMDVAAGGSHFGGFIGFHW